MKSKKITLERDKRETQRKVIFRQALPYHEDPVRNAEMPALYLDKAFVRLLGNPQIIEVTVRNADEKYGEGNT